MTHRCPGCPGGTVGDGWAGHPDVEPLAQYESVEHVLDFTTGRRSPADDDRWAESGAPSAAEYAAWAPRACGLACLRTILRHRRSPVPRTYDLVRAVEPYGVYPPAGGPGLVYQPFLRYLSEHHGLSGQVVNDLALALHSPVLGVGGWLIWSVHFSIRVPDQVPPATGGHLVLVHGHDAANGTVSFANPSGHLPSTRAATLPVATFARFAAPRGMALVPC